MIPFLDFTPVIQLFLHVVRYFKYKRLMDEIIDAEQDLEMILLSSMSMRISIQYCNICTLMIQYMRIRSLNKRKKRLIKPHFLIRLLHNYRFKLFTSI